MIPDSEIYNGYVVTLSGLVLVRIVKHGESGEPVLEINGKVVKAIVEQNDDH